MAKTTCRAATSSSAHIKRLNVCKLMVFQKTLSNKASAVRLSHQFRQAENDWQMRGKREESSAEAARLVLPIPDCQRIIVLYRTAHYHNVLTYQRKVSQNLINRLFGRNWI